MSKQVQIRRKKMSSHLPDKLTNDSIRVIGSVLDSTGRNPLGLPDKDEQKRLMELILGVEPSEKEFPEKVKDYLRNIRLKVPTAGTVLNVTVGEDGNPVNPEEYFFYKWIKAHPQVADTLREMESNANKQFYIHDPEIETKRQNLKVQDKKAAYKAFSKLSEDEQLMDKLVRLLTDHKPEKVSKEQKENLLAQQIEIDPKRFLRFAEDDNLKIRAEIEHMVEEGILRKSGNSYIFIDEVIGDNIEDAIAFFKSDRNSSLVLDMRAKLKEMAA